MKIIQREDVHIVNRHSPLSEPGIERVLGEKIYNDKEAWQKFLRLLFITLGVGFTVAGIIIFFAYNWDELHKFVKIGLIAGLIVATTLIALFSRVNLTIRNIILTGSAVLVVVLFAVFGQIYQTGANAYDFFLAWTIFITLWVIVADFAPLWVVYLVLISTTLFLYEDQVAQDWPEVLVFTLLFVIHTVVLLVPAMLSRYRKATIIIPNWFLNTVALPAAGYATIGITFGIFIEFDFTFGVLLLLASVFFALGIVHGLNAKNGFYLSVVPFCLIVIVSAFLIKVSKSEVMFLFISLFIIGSVTLVIKNLIHLQRKWNNEK